MVLGFAAGRYRCRSRRRFVTARSRGGHDGEHRQFHVHANELTVKAGTTIIFRNGDDIPHSIVGGKGEFHSKALDTGDSFSFTFTKAGSYGYFCGLHPHMQGKIVVTP
jgi:plastocyanin